jgi:hypothetical protein
MEVETWADERGTTAEYQSHSSSSSHAELPNTTSSTQDISDANANTDTLLGTGISALKSLFSGSTLSPPPSPPLSPSSHSSVFSQLDGDHMQPASSSSSSSVSRRNRNREKDRLSPPPEEGHLDPRAATVDHDGTVGLRSSRAAVWRVSRVGACV